MTLSRCGEALGAPLVSVTDPIAGTSLVFGYAASSDLGSHQGYCCSWHVAPIVPSAAILSTTRVKWCKCA